MTVVGMALRTLLPRLPSWGSGLRADTNKEKQFCVAENSEVWVDNMTANLQMPIHFTNNPDMTSQFSRLPSKVRKKRFSYWEEEESQVINSLR